MGMGNGEFPWLFSCRWGSLCQIKSLNLFSHPELIAEFQADIAPLFVPPP